ASLAWQSQDREPAFRCFFMSSGWAIEARITSALHFSKQDHFQMNATCFWQQQALGAAVSLLPRSPRYRDMRLKDVERRLVPAISRGQIKFYVADGEPQAFATWAYLTREAADGLLTGERELVDADFDAGEETWLIDLVAAPGKALPVVRDLRGTVFAGRSLRRLRRGADRSWRCVHMWRV